MARTTHGLRWRAVALRVRADASRYWVTWLLVGVLLGLAAGAVAAAFAAARRTDTAYDRFVTATSGLQAAVTTCDQQGENCPDPEVLLAQVQGVNGVTQTALVLQYAAELQREGGAAVDPTGDYCYSGPGAPLLLVAPGRRFGTEINRMRLVDGRPAAADDEVVVSAAMAERAGLAIGDRLFLGNADCEGPSLNPRVGLTIVGTGVMVGEVPPERGWWFGGIHGEPGLEKVLDGLGYRRAPFVAAQLEPGLTVDGFLERAAAQGIELNVLLDGAGQERQVERGLDSDENTLILLGSLAALAGIGLLAPTIGRQARSALSDAPVLRSIGATWRELAAIGAGHGAAIALAAVPVLMAVMSLASLRTPVGRAALIEVDPGLDLDALVAVAAVAAVFLFGTLVAGVATWNIGRARERPVERTTAAARAASWAHLPPPAAVGVRMALEPKHRSARVPVRSGLLGIVIAVATIVGVLTYRASLEHLTSTPALAGWNWDDGFGWRDDAGGSLTDEEVFRLTSSASAAARRTPGVRTASLASFWNQPGGEVTLVRAGDRSALTRFIALETGPGSVQPSITAGRAAAGPGEVTLSAPLLREFGVDHGDTVELVADDGTSLEFVVVGTSVVPGGGDGPEGLIASGALTMDGFRRFQPEFPGDMLMFELDGTTTRDDVRATLVAAGYPIGTTFGESIKLGVEELVGTSLSDTYRLPLLLGGLMALAGLGALAHLIAVASRSRRHELGILRAIGFRERQVVGAVGVQALALVLLACAVGFPVGLLCARVAWSATAERLGVVDVTTLPWSALAAALVVMLLLAVVAAAAPAFAATRVPAAEVLRAE